MTELDLGPLVVNSDMNPTVHKINQEMKKNIETLAEIEEMEKDTFDGGVESNGEFTINVFILHDNIKQT